MTAEIITIGDEILIGQIVDTNSAHIAQELNKIGISVHQITSVEDQHSHILTTLEEASKRADIVILTGGLGPTKDDVTKGAFCAYFEDVLVRNEEVLAQVEALFKKINNSPISDLNREQAMVPSKAIVLNNKYGTAPGLWMKKGATVFIAMPGVPFEMKALMELEVIPKLVREFKRPFIFHKTIRTFGLAESALAERLEAWENSLPKAIKLAYLPGSGTVRLRLSGKGEDRELLRISIEGEFEKIYPLLEDILSNGLGEAEELPASVSRLLISKKQSLSLAESCSGGEIAARFTKIPGVSSCFKGGLVSYATQAKEDILGVSAGLIASHGVVSGQVAEKMAQNARKIFKSDYALSTTGVAGPSKGDSQAEVGTVFIGLATPQGIFSKKFEFTGNREQIVERSVNEAFKIILKELL